MPGYKVLNKYWAHKCLLWAKYLTRIKKQNSLSSQRVQMNIYYAYILVQAHKFQLFLHEPLLVLSLF